MPAKTQKQIDYDERQKQHIRSVMRWADRNGYPLPTREWKYYRYRTFPRAVADAYHRSDSGRIDIPCPLHLVEEGRRYPYDYPSLYPAARPTPKPEPKPEPKYPLRMDTDITPEQVYDAREWAMEMGFDVGADPDGMPYPLFLAYLRVTALDL